MKNEIYHTDIVPYTKKTKNRAWILRLVFLLFVVLAAISLAMVLYKSGRELLSFFFSSGDAEACFNALKRYI